eukprot:727-Heterococcus_DN1.PRE.1
MKLELLCILHKNAHCQEQAHGVYQAAAAFACASHTLLLVTSGTDVVRQQSVKTSRVQANIYLLDAVHNAAPVKLGVADIHSRGVRRVQQHYSTQCHHNAQTGATDKPGTGVDPACQRRAPPPTAIYLTMQFCSGSERYECTVSVPAV